MWGCEDLKMLGIRDLKKDILASFLCQNNQQQNISTLNQPPKPASTPQQINNSTHQ
jgi:hypothetical protein